MAKSDLGPIHRSEGSEISEISEIRILDLVRTSRSNPTLELRSSDPAILRGFLGTRTNCAFPKYYCYVTLPLTRKGYYEQ